jgi:hypothetical protein
MKRGLVVLDPQEIPTEELVGRVSKLQYKLRQQGIAAALIYGDVYRSGDITYLTNNCIYWNEGLIIVPASGEPALLTKLSSRVHTWMRAISNLKDLRSGPDLPGLISKFLEDITPGTVGLVEMEWWPAGLVDNLRTKLAGWRLQDMGQIVQLEREQPSTNELKLLQRSADISAKAVAAGLNRTLSNPERAGKAEMVARMAGVEDVLVLCHPAGAEADTTEVLAEFRGYWTIAARVVFKNDLPNWAPMVGNAYKAAEQRLKAGVVVSQLREAVAEQLASSKFPWKVDLIHHTDLETRGDYRLPGEETNAVQAGAVVGLRLEVTFADGTQAVIADTFVISDNTATCLTKGLPHCFF